MEHAHRIHPEHARVLVTGATSGVGEITARLLASRGARVALLARRSDELQRVVADLGIVSEDS
jgi:NADP-dependent 3-hydroxy acid dehydrogenase YdfG